MIPYNEGMTAPAPVKFETKCCEHDWEVLLKTDRL